MKALKILFTLTLLFVFHSGLNAQNGHQEDGVIATISFKDNCNGSGYLTFRIVGPNLPGNITVNAIVTGERIVGGGYTCSLSPTTRPVANGPREIIQSVIVPLSPAVGHGSSNVDVHYEVVGASLHRSQGDVTIPVLQNCAR